MEEVTSRAEASALSVWAIVLNFDSADLTTTCIRSLRACPSVQHILVVDNGSTPAGRAELRTVVAAMRSESVSLLERDPNAGYAGGIQSGIRRALDAGADLLLLMNNDCQMNEAAAAGMVAAMRNDRTIGVCGVPVEHEGWTDYGSRFAYFRVRRNAREPWRPGVSDVEFPPGDAWMLRSAAVREVGGIDSRLFTVGEETDWCARARRAGWRSCIVGDAAVKAEVSATMRRYAPETQYYLGRNLLWLVRRNQRGPRRFLALVFAAVYVLPRTLGGRLLARDEAGFRFALRGCCDGLFRDCRHSDDPEDALPSRVGRYLASGTDRTGP